jgi:hypothetical protein
MLSKTRTGKHLILHLHSITSSGVPFSKAEYSVFKYGSRKISLKMGKELGKSLAGFLTEFNCSEMQDIILYSSPYDSIPTSSLYLTEHCYEHIRNATPFNCRMGKVNRLNTYAENYGAMSAVERFALISRDTYSFKEIPDPNDLLLFVDDVSITGTHQKVIENLLDIHNMPNKCLFVYYGKLTDNSPPQIEAELNSSSVNGYLSLAELVLSGDYVPTTRAIKYILSFGSVDLALFFGLINKRCPSFFSELLMLASANKYDKIAAYSGNIKAIADMVRNQSDQVLT